MRFHEKLQELRRGRGLSQEALAEMLDVSRQAVSKWESGQAYPETDKLIAISEIFGVTLDSLIKDGPLEYQSQGGSRYAQGAGPWRAPTFEYKSKRTLFGLPLVHVHLGFGLKRARGIIAIGILARGFLSIGLLSAGLLSIGVLSAGLIGIGVFALGLLLAIGSIAFGTVAIGAIAIGIFALGALSIGMVSTGALAVASHVAIGDHAYGHIAVGRTVAQGVQTFLATPPGGSLSTIDAAEVERAIAEEFPNLWQGFVRWVRFFLR